MWKYALAALLLVLAVSDTLAQVHPYLYRPVLARSGGKLVIARVPNVPHARGYVGPQAPFTRGLVDGKLVPIVIPGARPGAVPGGMPGALPGTVPAPNPIVQPMGPPRLDFRIAAPPAMIADMPNDNGGGFAAAREGSYQLIAPPTGAGRSLGLLLYIGSPSQREFTALGTLCQKMGLALAVPVNVGDDVHPGVRLRRSVAVFDDVRRRLPIDTDRVYVGGLYGGAQTASQIAFTFPEYCGGLLALGNTISLRAEPYMRERVRKRVSVALVTGQHDVARHELERYRKPALEAAGVKVKLITVPGVGAGLPPMAALEQGLTHLEMGRVERLQLGRDWPSLRVADGGAPSAEDWPRILLDEGKARLRVRGNVEGLLILHGITQRWPDAPAAKEAHDLLADHDRKSPRKWEEIYNRVQLDHYHREAQALDAFYKTLINIPAGAQLVAPLRENLLQNWEQVAHFGPETRQGVQARKRLEELKKVEAPARR